MKLKTTILCAALLPALGALAACKQDGSSAAGDMAAPSTAAPAGEPATDAMSAAPTDGMAAADMQSDPTQAQTDTGLPADPAAMSTDAGTPFAVMDRNGDGGIGMDELDPTSMLHEHFSAADADGNGMLSEDEVNKHNADMAAPTPQ